VFANDSTTIRACALCGGLLECDAPRGPRGGAFQHLVDAVRYGMVLVYISLPVPASPRTDHTPTKYIRNEEIRARYAAGETIDYLARLFDISEQRVSQIIRGQRK
jgi:hypothetical protein